MQHKKINKFKGFVYKLKPFNRRKYPRFKVSHYLKCNCVYTDSGEERSFSAEIVDVSMGGFLLMTGNVKIYPETELKISFQLPHRQEEISIHSRAVRTYRRHKEVCYYLGVRHNDDNKKDDIKLLLDFVLESNRQTQ